MSVTRRSRAISWSRSTRASRSLTSVVVSMASPRTSDLVGRDGPGSARGGWVHGHTTGMRRDADRDGAAPGAAGPPPAGPAGSAWGRRRLPAAGPLLIAACVAFATRGFLFGDRLTNHQPDVLSMWLPHFCFLGHSLAAGQIPAFNPFQMAGMPYASDPQS